MWAGSSMKSSCLLFRREFIRQSSVEPRRRNMFCQSCGAEAPTKHVAFYQNIGALVMRFTRAVEGNLCKSCIHRHFWKFTLVNVTLGWWGLHSLIITPFFLLNNLFRYLSCLGMPSAAGAAAGVDQRSRRADRSAHRGDHRPVEPRRAGADLAGRCCGPRRRDARTSRALHSRTGRGVAKVGEIGCAVIKHRR